MMGFNQFLKNIKSNNMLDILKKNNTKNDIYLGLSLQEQGGKALLLQYNEQQSSAITLGSKLFSYSNAWERLVEDVDEVLFELEKVAQVKATKTVIFVYSHLVNEKTHEIKEPYFDKIKAIADELGLEMIGFMEHHEALIEHLSKSGAGQLNAVVCEIDSSLVSMFVYRNGNLDFTKTIERTTDYIDTLEVALVELSKTKTLPLRIILYGIGTLDSDATLFMSKRWPKDMFVQLPKVETMTTDQMDIALIEGFKSQLNPSNSSSSLFSPLPEVSLTVQAETQESSSEQPANTLPISPSTGFVLGKDIQDTTGEIEESAPPTTVEEVSAINSENAFVAPSYSVPQKGSGISLPFKIPHFGRLAPSGLLIAISGLILIIIGIFSLLYFFHKANVTLLYDTKPIAISMMVDAKSLSVTSHIKQIPATGSIETTGAKFIGDKARGEVSLLNKSKQSATIPRGTTLLGPKNLKFLTDSEVKVASASEQLTTDGNVLTVTGKEKVLVTATEIGEEYNLGKDTKFDIEGGSSNVVATATKSLDGGSKKEVRTASKTDFDTLRKKVLVSVKKKTSLTVKSENDTQVIEPLTQVTLSAEKYSKEVAEEASDLKLTATARVKYYEIPVPTAKDLLLAKLKKSLPADQTLDQKAILFTVKSAKLNHGKPEITLDVRGLPRQRVDIVKVKNSLIGKPVSKIKEISKQYQANGYEYQIQTELPLLKSRLPFFAKNLNVIVKTIR